MVWLLLASLAGPGLVQETAGELYERAYYLEQGRGDLEGAIELYVEVVDRFPDARIAARSLFRLAMCYERLRDDQAEQTYARLLTEYSEDTVVADLARERLSRIEASRAGKTVELPSGIVQREILLPSGVSVGDGGATLSPDGTMLVYYDVSLEGVVVMSLERRAPIMTASIRNVSGYAPTYRWSFDGRFVAFEAYDGVAWSVVVLTPAARATSQWYRGAEALFPMGWDPEVGLWCRREREIVRLEAAGRARAVPVEREMRELALSPDGSHIAFVAGGDVYLRSIGDGEVRVNVNVAPHDEEEAQPVWSPDGRHLAFLSRRADRWDLWAVAVRDGRAAGEPALVVPNLGRVAIRDWLSDGRLVFARSESLRDIWLLPMAVGTATPEGEPFLLPTPTRGTNLHPRFTRGGESILYRTMASDDGASPRLVIASLDGTIETAVPTARGTLNAVPSPDGAKIWEAVIDRERAVWLVEEIDVASRRRRRPLGEIGFRYPPGADFSRDGRRVLLNREAPESEAAVETVEGLFFFELEDGAVTPLAGIDTMRPGRISPNGEHILYHYHDDGSVRVARTDGTEAKRVVELGEGEFVAHWFSFSPDGRYVAYPRGKLTGPPDGFERSLWIAAVDGSTNEEIRATAGVRPVWVDWSPDGRYIAYSGLEGYLSLWTLENFWPPKR